MEIKPLICPQCGGEIRNYSPGKSSVTCGYCGIQFLVEPSKKDVTAVAFQPETPTTNFPLIAIVGLVSFLVIGGLILSVVKGSSSKSSSAASRPSTPASQSSPVPAPSVKPLEFGGTGTLKGLFNGAESVAVDKQGRIYVGDDSLRVQQFNEKGEFLKVLQCPPKTPIYSRAGQINKIAIDDDGYLYVALGGVILVYDDQMAGPRRAIQTKLDYIHDFALTGDGGVLAVSSRVAAETLNFFNKDGKITRRIDGFHSKAANVEMTPKDTAVMAIRVADDADGNIYSIYAFGNLGNREVTYRGDEPMILQFDRDGRYVAKFVKTQDSCGLVIDNKGRIYVSNENTVEVYSNGGDFVAAIRDIGELNAFTLDKENNVYALVNDKVVKRSAIP